MKNNILLATLISTIFISSAFAGSFGQRWGANSHITNLPLFFQSQIYNDGSTKKTKKIINKKSATIIRNTRECADNSNSLPSTRHSQQTQVAFAKMKARQNALERQKTKLHNKITDLEKQEYELTHIKNEKEKLTISG